ncbi:hypothetical protein F0562_022538 [Nyssa sinensis]|uniref:Uncharacterized protein n=1 Tax=Nyssa sinensis TaxID=561372 RepID=A0A5J5BPB5_9ASTE|nr:hypothetical protein F0562_022538 [Nyssa sinensis]
MASKAVVPHQPRGGEKQRNGQADGRNRRVLRDIGNLVSVPAVEGKNQTQISRAITRSFCTQLANSQAAAEKKKKSLVEIVNGGVIGKDGTARKAAAAQKKESEKTKPEITSHDDEVKSKEVGRVGSSSSRKPVKTLTAILTARSKAACGLSNEPKDPLLVDIDAADVDNELAVVEYVEDIYKFYKLTEDESRVDEYMGSQPDINSKMRSILVDWLIEVHRKFELMPETLYLTINIVDRYLSMKTVPRSQLQLVGISSMLIACKYEEIWAPEVKDFIVISANAYVREEVLSMEKAILGKLEWYLTVPTPYVFLIRYIKASVPFDQEEMESVVFFLAELVWTQTLKHQTGYSEDQLMECAKLLVSFHSDAANCKLKAVYRKFSSPDRGSVALFPPAKSLIVSNCV